MIETIIQYLYWLFCIRSIFGLVFCDGSAFALEFIIQFLYWLFCNGSVILYWISLFIMQILRALKCNDFTLFGFVEILCCSGFLLCSCLFIRYM